MEWKKAGGQLLDEKEQSKTKKKKQHSPEMMSTSQTIFQNEPRNLETELVDSVSSLIYRLFS